MYTERHELKNTVWSYAWDQESYSGDVTAAKWCIPTITEIIDSIKSIRSSLKYLDVEQVGDNLTDVEDCIGQLRNWLEELPFPNDPRQGQRLLAEALDIMNGLSIPEPDEMTTELRIRCTEKEWWTNTGHSDYDQDHRGVCALAAVTSAQDNDDIEDDAIRMVEEMWEMIFQMGGSTHIIGQAASLDEAKAIINHHLAAQKAAYDAEEA